MCDHYVFAITLADADRGRVDWECPHCHFKKKNREIAGLNVLCPSCMSLIKWTWKHHETQSQKPSLTVSGVSDMDS
jgi:hypothetical protein